MIEDAARSSLKRRRRFPAGSLPFRLMIGGENFLQP
jgi:hypothetical protein